MDTQPQPYTPTAGPAADADEPSYRVLEYLLGILQDAPEQHDDPEAEALRGEVRTHVNRYVENLGEDDEAAAWDLSLAREAAVQYQALERWGRTPSDKGDWEEQRNKYRGTV